ncbi:hypothetical protein D9758_015008 [Tetrapyrgos nigripes]|uniref:Uncharacterized protein n=1 Tax=Tetrapyrgos nigripes TaxID=182062 RepID=A0A8H5CET3_9AGAR|nr:hypothetical protein D9758_015008 [Tetrapyrgos nigripes]
MLSTAHIPRRRLPPPAVSLPLKTPLLHPLKIVHYTHTIPTLSILSYIHNSPHHPNSLIPSILFLSPFIPTRLIAFFGVALPVLSSNPYYSFNFTITSLPAFVQLSLDMVPLTNTHTNPPNSPSSCVLLPKSFTSSWTRTSDPEVFLPSIRPQSSYYPNILQILPKTFHHSQRIFTEFPHVAVFGTGVDKSPQIPHHPRSLNEFVNRSNLECRVLRGRVHRESDGNSQSRWLFSSSPSTSPTVKKAKKAAKSNTNTNTNTHPTQTRNALLNTLAPLPPFALIPLLLASAMGHLVEEGGVETEMSRELEQKVPEQSEYKENQNQKRPSLSMLSPKRTFPSSSSSANHINSISPEITQAIQTFKKGFSKSNLGTERAPWTRGRDGFGGINLLGVGFASGSGSGNTSTSMGTGTSGGGRRRTMSTMSGAHGDGDEVEEDSGSGSGYEAGPGPGPGPAALGPGMIRPILLFFLSLGPLASVMSCLQQPNLLLAPGWKFIETEDWRVDYDAGAGAGASSVGAFKTDKDKVSSPLSIDAEDGRDGDEDGDGDGEDGEDDGGEDEGDFGNRKSGRWLNITFKVGVRKCTRPIGPSHVRQARQSREERQEQWEQEQQERKRKLEISFFIVFGVSVDVDVGFHLGEGGELGLVGELELGEVGLTIKAKTKDGCVVVMKK